MAQKQKRLSPLDEPPTASSSDSEEEDQRPSSKQQGEDEESEEEEEASSEEEDDDDDDDNEEEDQPSLPSQPPSKNPPPPPTNSHPKPSSSESATESDSGSDSEPDQPAPAPNPKVKPLASKPMEQTPKAKPQPSAAAAPARSGSKRPGENNGHVTDPKKAKKKVTETAAAAAAAASDEETEEDGKKSGDDSKKLFQRLWSEEDEIAILKGMVEFSSKTGNDPLKYANAFHDFMKKSLHVDASSNQLKQKIRRLKKKFENNAGKGKNGEGPTFSKPHDQKAFELSKKVWASSGGGGNAVVEKVSKSNGKAGKSPKKEGSRSRNAAASPKKPKPEPKHEPELALVDSKESGKMDIETKPDTSLHLSEMIRMSGLNEDVVKRGMELIGASKRAELEGRWKKLQVAELELFVKRAQLIEDQARMILEAFKSSEH